VRAVVGDALPRAHGRAPRIDEAGRDLRRAPSGDPRYRAEHLPVWSEFDAPAYGIPIVDQRGFKVAHDVYGPPFDPTAGERVVDPASIAAVREHLRRRFPGLADAPVVETRVCQYETTPDTHFILDRHPGGSNVWIAGGGSGHGFKHGPSIGAYLVGLLEGRTPEELDGADAARFRLGPRAPGPAYAAPVTVRVPLDRRKLADSTHCGNQAATHLLGPSGLATPC
jgi:glycine/D-amino acid oxidase-like deaminating enzyme